MATAKKCDKHRSKIHAPHFCAKIHIKNYGSAVLDATLLKHLTKHDSYVSDILVRDLHVDSVLLQ